ncbi:hypothetical protein BDW_03410 [Bdellovibrio bacteriovorus W]|nr:hypothetical protein BDW_03410 [Bdellovibrio bacteriovorus W]
MGIWESTKSASSKIIKYFFLATVLTACTSSFEGADGGDESSVAETQNARFENPSDSRFKVETISSYKGVKVPVLFSAEVEVDSVDIDVFKISGCEDAILDSIEKDLIGFDPETDKWFRVKVIVDVPEHKCTVKDKPINVEVDLAKVRLKPKGEEFEGKSGKGILKTTYFTDNRGPVLEAVIVGARELRLVGMSVFSLEDKWGFDRNEMPESITFKFNDNDTDWKTVLRSAITISNSGSGFNCVQLPVSGSPIKNQKMNSFTVPLQRSECDPDTQIKVNIDLSGIKDLSGNEAVGSQDIVITRAVANIDINKIELDPVVHPSAETLYLNEGKTVEILIDFDAAVEIGTTGLPELPLKIGSKDVKAENCQMMLMPNKVKCTYTVGEVENGNLDINRAGKIEYLEPALKADIRGNPRKVLGTLTGASNLLSGKVVVDTTPPEIDPDGLKANTGVAGLNGFKLTAKFIEPVSYLEEDKDKLFSVETSSCAQIQTPVLSSDKKVITADVKTETCTAAEMNVSFEIDLTKLSDRAGNIGQGMKAVLVSIHTAIPTPSISVTKSILNKDGKATVKLEYSNFKTISLSRSHLQLLGVDDFDTTSCELAIAPVGSPDDGIRIIEVSKCTGDGKFKVKIAANSAINDVGNKAAEVESAEIEVDNTAPEVENLGVEFDSATKTITITFVEEVILADTEQSGKVCDVPTTGTPVCENATSIVAVADAKKIELTINGELVGSDYQIQLEGVFDKAGNKLLKNISFVIPN